MTGMDGNDYCADCGSSKIEIQSVRQTIRYRSRNDNQVKIKVVLPLHVCNKCGFKYFTSESEDIREGAVQEYLRKEVEKLVFGHFGEQKKTQLWMKSENPLLGGISPMAMIRFNRGEKLLAFVKGCLDGNKPPE